MLAQALGLPRFPRDTIEELMQHADVTTYRAKNTGLEFAVYSTEDNEYSSRQLQLIAELRDAVYGEQLELHYQPKFDLASDRLIGVEALVRWRPSRGWAHIASGVYRCGRTNRTNTSTY